MWSYATNSYSYITRQMLAASWGKPGTALHVNRYIRCTVAQNLGAPKVEVTYHEAPLIIIIHGAMATNSFLHNGAVFQTSHLILKPIHTNRNLKMC